MLNNFKIVEMFKSFQGEGKNLGQPAIFIRLFGCNENCGFCDEPLHKDARKIVIEGDAAEIVEKISPFLLEHSCGKDKDLNPLIIFTGGEPTLYNLPRLIYALNASVVLPKFWYAVETNGSGKECLENLPSSVFVTISPKRVEHLAALNFRYFCGEVKIPLWGGGEDFFDSCLAVLSEKDLGMIDLWATPINHKVVIDSNNNAFASRYVEDVNKRWAEKLGKFVRLNVQAHKVWGVM